MSLAPPRPGLLLLRPLEGSRLVWGVGLPLRSVTSSEDRERKRDSYAPRAASVLPLSVLGVRAPPGLLFPGNLPTPALACCGPCVVRNASPVLPLGLVRHTCPEKRLGHLMAGGRLQHESWDSVMPGPSRPVLHRAASWKHHCL